MADKKDSLEKAREALYKAQRPADEAPAGDVPAATPEQEAYKSMGIGDRTNMEMERGAKLVAQKANQRKRQVARQKEAGGRTFVTEEDGTPVPTNPDA